LPVCLERTLEAEYMLLRECRQSDLPALIDLTIEAFRPFFEGDLPEVLDPRVFAHDHGNWKEKYRAEVPALHDANSNRFIILAEDSERPLGYVGWQVTPTAPADSGWLQSTRRRVAGELAPRSAAQHSSS
jgi:hypothetical protein